MQVNDYAPHKALYLTCFPEDSEADADFLFEKVLSKAECVAAHDGDRLISMLFLMESELQAGGESMPFYYLYAACTDPAYRGRGVMRDLLRRAQEFSRERGKCGIFLKPAKPSLFAFYARSGFQPFFHANIIRMPAADFWKQYAARTPGLDTTSEIPPVAVRSLDFSSWFSRRANLLSTLSDCAVSFSAPLLSAAVSDCGFCADSAGNCAAFERRGDLLLIKELLFLPENAAAALDLTAALLQAHPARNLELRMPPSKTDAAFAPFGAVDTPFGVLWSEDFDSLRSCRRPYFGFAFD